MKPHILLLIAVLASSAAETKAQIPTAALELDKPIEREMKGGDKHEYLLAVAANDFLRIEAEQKGLDVVLVLSAPDGSELVKVNNPNGTQSPETIVYISETSAEYRLEVRTSARENRTGRYKIVLNEMRPGTDADAFLVAGHKSKAAGDALMEGGGENASAKAFETYEAAVALYRRSNDNASKALLLRTIGQIYDDIIYERAKAVEYLTDSYNIYKVLGMMREAVGVMNMIGIAHENLLEYDKAVETYERALVLAMGMNDKALQARTYNQLGRGHARQGDYNRSLDDFKKALSLNDGNGWNSDRSVTLMGLAVVYNALGNPMRALEYAIENVNGLESSGAASQTSAQLLNIGNIYLGHGNFQLARHYYQKALEGFERRLAPVGTSYALANLGEVSAKEGHYSEAISYLERSRQMKTKFMPKDPGSLASIARVYAAEGKYVEAEEHYQKSLDLYLEIKGFNFAASTMDEMAAMYYRQGSYAKSLHYSQQAVVIANKLNYPNAWMSLTASGLARKALGQIREAKSDLESAIGIIESLRGQAIIDPNSREGIFQNISGPYQGLVSILMSEGSNSEAFAVAERYRSRMLLEIINAERRDTAKSLTAKERETERRLKNDIATLNKQIGSSKDDASREEFRRELQTKRLEYEDFVIRLAVAHPKLRLQRGEIKPITFERALALIPDDKTAVLEFVVDADQTLAFIVSKDAAGKGSLRTTTLKLDNKTLRSHVEQLRKMLENGSLDFAAGSRKLHSSLLSPLSGYLAGKTNLIIVPDGPLWELPFQALMDDKGIYLVEKLAVSYAPSLTALVEMRNKAKERRSSAEAQLIAFGNPQVSKETTDRVKRVFMSSDLAPIPEAERLVKELRKIYGPSRSEVFTGPEAREEIAKNESPKYRIVQFATHGVLDNMQPMYSHLIFAQGDSRSSEDGLLEAWELKDLDLKADMLILTACDTARGRVSGGEGVIGMTWASFIAGAPTTVASQWKVESSSTTELMLEFHRQLLSKKKVSKAEALRRAALKVMRMPKYRHPSYWAGFVIVGDAS